MKSDGWMRILPDRTVPVHSGPAERKPGEKHEVSNIYCDLSRLSNLGAIVSRRALDVQEKRGENKLHPVGLLQPWLVARLTNRSSLLVSTDTDGLDGCFAALRGLPQSFG